MRGGIWLLGPGFLHDGSSWELQPSLSSLHKGLGGKHSVVHEGRLHSARQQERSELVLEGFWAQWKTVDCREPLWGTPVRMGLITLWLEWIPSISVLILWSHLFLDFSFLPPWWGFWPRRPSGPVAIFQSWRVDKERGCIDPRRPRVWFKSVVFYSKKEKGKQTGFKVQLFPFPRICHKFWLCEKKIIKTIQRYRRALGK